MNENKKSEIGRGNPVNINRRGLRSYRPSLIWPAILITIGIVLLLKNIGVLGGDAWITILHLWPVLLIALGLESLFQKRGVVGPVFWIVLGVVFFLSEMGITNWDSLEILLRFWPLILIALGLDVLLPRRSLWASMLGLIIMLVVFAGALWFMGVRILIH
jgi:energy-converting hydrogenase Eha subunit A